MNQASGSESALTRLEQLAAAISDGATVDWDAETARASELGPLLERLRLIERLSSVYRFPTSPTTGTVSIEERAPVEPVSSDAPRWASLFVLRKIGEGTSTELHAAYDPSRRVEVFLKTWNAPTSEEDATTRDFLVCARRLCRTRHPNMVATFGATIHEGRLGLWMEMLRGQTLESFITEHGPVDVGEAVEIGLDLCGALDACHASGVIHRAVDTRHVMRTNGGRIVLIGFGPAEARQDSGPLEPSDPRRSRMLAWAPERFTGEPVGPSTDVYGVGMVLFRLLTGRHLIEAASIEELRARFASGKAASLAAKRLEIPPTLSAIIERATSPRTDQRHASVAQLAHALSEISEGGP